MLSHVFEQLPSISAQGNTKKPMQNYGDDDDVKEPESSHQRDYKSHSS